MRIADTILRGGHLSEDALAEAWYAGEHPVHLDACEICAERALELSRWLDDTKQMAVGDADAAFPVERLAAQQHQILRKLEAVDRPSKLLSFPRAAAALVVPDGHSGRRISAGWVAAAAAAGIVLGVVADRMTVDRAIAPVPISAKAQTVVPPIDRVDIMEDGFDGEIAGPRIPSLRTLEDLMPGGSIARTSLRGR